MKGKLKIIGLIFLVTISVFLVLKEGFGESYVQYTMRSFFESIYNLKSSDDPSDSEWEDILNFIDVQTDLLCSEAVKETYLHNYLHILNKAYMNLLEITVKDIRFSETSKIKGEATYTFVVTLSVNGNKTKEQTTLSNKGEIHLKQSFLNYRIMDLKMEVDQLKAYVLSVD